MRQSQVDHSILQKYNFIIIISKRTKMEGGKNKRSNWNEQNRKRYLIYLRYLNRQNDKTELIITHSHWKYISPYIFKQNYKQSHGGVAYNYHQDKLTKYKNIKQIIENESNKYFHNQAQINKYLQELEQWQHDKQLAKVNWDQQEEDEQNGINMMNQRIEPHKTYGVSQTFQDLNILRENLQSNQNQQSFSFTRKYTINPMIIIFDEQESNSVSNQQNSSWTHKNHQVQQKNLSYFKLFQQFNRIKKIQTTKRAYQFETTVELNLPQILIANNQQTLLKYMKSEQFQKTKDSSAQLQNQYKKDNIKFQNRLYYLSQQINCIKSNVKSQEEQNKLKQMLLKIQIPYTLNFQFQFYQQENQRTNISRIRNRFINNFDRMIDQQQMDQQNPKQMKIVLQNSNPNEQNNEQEQNPYKRSQMVQKQQQNKNFRKQKFQKIKKKYITKQKQIKSFQVFWTQKQRIKLLAFIQYHLDKKQMDHMKMNAYLPNKKIKNFRSMIQSIKQNKNLKQFFMNHIFRQGLNQKKNKLNQKQLKIFQKQMKFLKQLDNQWINQRFLFFKNEINKIEYLIFNPHFRLPVQKIYEHEFDRSLIYLKNNKRFLKVKYCYKEKEVTTNIQKIDEQKNIQLQEQKQYSTKSIEISQKKSKGGRQQRWTQLEHIRYLIFLLKNKQILQQKDRWIRKGIHSEMSKFIKSRNVDKCQTKHKVMLSKYGSIQKTIQNLKSTIQNKALFDKQLILYESYLQNNIQQKISYSEHKIIRIGQIQKEFDLKNNKNFRNFLKINQQNVLRNLKSKIKLKLPKKLQKQCKKIMEITIMLILNFPIKCSQ